MIDLQISNNEDVIDSRDVIARIDYLGTLEETISEEEETELAALLALAKDASDYAADWQYGETLIRDTYFEDYARELADDLGLLPTVNAWPASYINWKRAADALRMDYSAVDFAGVTYWIR